MRPSNRNSVKYWNEIFMILFLLNNCIIQTACVSYLNLTNNHFIVCQKDEKENLLNLPIINIYETNIII